MLSARRPPAVLWAEMAGGDARCWIKQSIPYLIPAKDGIFDQYPETSISH